ncbi:hypothetical protein Emed_006596 [Eimeria media]
MSASSHTPCSSSDTHTSNYSSSSTTTTSSSSSSKIFADAGSEPAEAEGDLQQSSTHTAAAAGRTAAPAAAAAAAATAAAAAATAAAAEPAGEPAASALRVRCGVKEELRCGVKEESQEDLGGPLAERGVPRTAPEASQIKGAPAEGVPRVKVKAELLPQEERAHFSTETTAAATTTPAAATTAAAAAGFPVKRQKLCGSYLGVKDEHKVYVKLKTEAADEFGASGAAAAAAPAAAAAAEAAASATRRGRRVWACGVCTLHNPKRFLQCSACSTERPQGVSFHRSSSSSSSSSSDDEDPAAASDCSSVELQEEESAAAAAAAAAAADPCSVPWSERRDWNEGFWVPPAAQALNWGR